MNFKIKKTLILLFIVIALLLLTVNSVNAVDAYENNTLLDDSLSEADDLSSENFNNNIPEETIAINSDDGNEIEETNSVNEVSNSNGKLGSSDDSEVLSNFFNVNVETDTPVVKVGDYVIFDVFVQNQWQSYGGWWNPYLTINNWFNESELKFINITPTEWADNIGI